MRRPAAVATSLALLSSWAGSARAEAPASPVRKVAVLDVRPLGVDSSIAKTLTEVLSVEVARVDGVQVVTDAQIESLLGLEQKKQMAGCDDASCMAEIAGALGVDKVLSSSLGKVDELTVFTLHLIDVKTARQDASVLQHEKTASAFIDEMPALVQKLLVRPASSTASPMPSSRPSAPAAATTPAPASSGTSFGTLARRPWFWAAVGGGLILLGAVVYNANGGEVTGGDFTLTTLGIVSGLASFTMCICPWAPGSGGDEPPAPVLFPPAFSSAAGAVHTR